MMATFKKGDEVVLVPREGKWENLYPCYTYSMVECCKRGDVFVIMTHNVSGNIPIVSKEPPWRQWIVRPEWIEHYKFSMENV